MKKYRSLNYRPVEDQVQDNLDRQVKKETGSLLAGIPVFLKTTKQPNK